MTEHTDSDRPVHDYAADSNDRTSTRVLRCVSAATDLDPLDLPPLYDVVDPDALDALVPGDGRGGCSLSFRFAGTHVRVTEAGDVHVSTVDDV